MEQYTVTGMSCAACQTRVEKAVNKVPGVTSCAVSLLTNSMGVEGTADAKDIIAAVENAGYGASLKEAPAADKKSGSLTAKLAAEEDALKDRETPKLKRRLIASVVFLLILMYFSMGAHMWGWPVPSFMEGNHVAMGIVQMLLSGIIMVINQKFFISGFKSLFHGAPNMDSTIALGSGAAFAYSTVMLLAMSKAQVVGGSEAAAAYMDEFYFESAGMILTLITVGKMLESYSKGKTTNALKSLMQLAPKTANVIRNGQEVTVSIDDVQKDDIFVVRPGENIPVDGIVVEGTSAVNEAALTGESLPVDKEPGSEVSSATLNQSGFLKCRATRVGEDTTLSQIITLMSDAAATKAPVAKLADRISAVFVPSVILIAAATILIWLFVGADVGYALARGICVLVVSCPCALGLATPVAIMVGNGVGAKNGILFKNAEALQETGNVQIVALDKTGTITRGEPQVTDLIPAGECSEEELYRKAAALEAKSEHPLAKAVIKGFAELQEKNIDVAMLPEAEEFTALPGNGLAAKIDGSKIIGGSAKYISEIIRNGNQADGALRENLANILAKAEELSSQGKTPLLFLEQAVAEDNGASGVFDTEYREADASMQSSTQNGGRMRLLGMIAVADTMKEDSPQAIAELKKQGIHVVMLTGDNQRTAEAIGALAGVDEVVAGVLPDGKDSVIQQLQQHGKVAMVGDGINDAPALTRADIGIAIGAGADVAMDAADVVLMKSRLSDVSAAVRISRHTYKNIVENLFWALFYNVLLIPLAAGAYAHAFGLTMNPMWGAAAMSLSSFFVVMNALRLNLMKVRDTGADKPGKHSLSPNVKLLNTEGSAAADHLGKENAAMQEKKKDQEKAQTDESIVRGDINNNFKEDTMTKTISIEGMMCNHCEANVKGALEALEGVQSAQVSHDNGTAVVELTADVADDVLKAAVEAKDYKVTGIA